MVLKVYGAEILHLCNLISLGFSVCPTIRPMFNHMLQIPEND